MSGCHVFLPDHNFQQTSLPEFRDFVPFWQTKKHEFSAKLRKASDFGALSSEKGEKGGSTPLCASRPGEARTAGVQRLQGALARDSAHGKRRKTKPAAGPGGP